MARKKKSGRRSPGDGSVYREVIKGQEFISAKRTKTYWIGDKAVKKVLRKRGFENETAARQWLAENIKALDQWAAEENAKSDPEVLNEKNLTTKRLWAEYIKPEAHAYVDLSENTRKNYLLYYNKCESLYDKVWSAIKTMEFQKVIDACGSTYAPRKKCRTVLSAIGTFAISQGWARDNAVQNCKLPKNITKDKNIYTPEDINVIWNFYNGVLKPPKVSHRNGKYISDEDMKSACAAILIMCHTGVRPSELRNFKAENIDMEEREIKHAGIKTMFGKEGVIFFTVHVKDLIQKYVIDHGNVFAGINEATLRKRIKLTCAYIGIGEHLPSAGRTSAATILAELGVNEEELRRVLRHTTTAITRKYYDKSSNKRAKEALSRISEAVDITPEQKIENYEKMIEELKEKIRVEREKLDE